MDILEQVGFSRRTLPFPCQADRSSSSVFHDWEGLVKLLSIHTIDEATRFRVLRVHDHNNTESVMDFLNEVRESSRNSPTGRPEVNGKVEPSYKTDREEF